MTRLAPAIVHLLQRPDAERRLGSFFLVKPLGHGGFAPVWLAKEGVGSAELRTAAVKLFPLDGAGEEVGGAGTAGRRLIVEEARALCKVEHANVVKFYTLCVDESAGVLGLAMEHLAGTPLNERIAAAGCLSVEETIRVGIAIASALSAVHRAKLVHRDVKPSNVVEAAGVYKLIDFGIAATDTLNAAEPTRRETRAGDGEWAGASTSRRAQAGAEATVRVIGFQSGTLGYIDPVCLATGAPASSASDLYALGATLFECLAGEVPASAAMPGTGQIEAAVLEGRSAPPPLRSLVPEVPEPLAELVDSMLAPIRHTRPPSAQWVASRLEEIRLELQAEATWTALERIGTNTANTAKALLLALTTPDGTRATRTMEEITAIAGPAAGQIIDSLSTGGLIVTHGQGVMLADEALVRHWRRLREWLKEVREDRLFAEELERDARRWHSDPDTVRLWQKRRLASGEELCGREDIRISAKAVVFLQASRRAERRLRAWIAIAAAAVALSPVIAGIAYWRAAGAKERTAQENDVSRPVVAREEMRSGEPSRAASAPRALGAPETERDDAGDRIRETRPAADSAARHPKTTPVPTSPGQPTRPPASTSPPSLEPVEKW